MSGSSLVFCFQLASLLGSALTAVKLFRTGLFHKYQFFFYYFVFRVFNGIWPLYLNPRGEYYVKFWVISEPLTWVFYVGVVLELYRLVLERHKGLYTLGRWALYFGMTISVGLSILSLLLHIKPAQKSKALSYIYPIDRGITLCLAIFLILMLFLISRYPVSLSRNVILHAGLYTVFFLSNTLGIILSTVFGLRIYTEINIGLMVVSCACVYSWLIFLSTKGEEVRVSIPHFGPEHEERLLYQLDSLNTTLLKVARK
jgi:hypothetical protein